MSNMNIWVGPLAANGMPDSMEAMDLAVTIYIDTTTHHEVLTCTSSGGLDSLGDMLTPVIWTPF